MDKPKELIEQKSATQKNLRNKNEVIWDKLNLMTTEDQDNFWFQLTQKHLKEFRDGETDTTDFENDEDALIFLNHIGISNSPIIERNMSQRGFLSTSSEHFRRIENFGAIIEFIKKRIFEWKGKSDKPFYILVSGIGSSGKASSRKALAGALESDLPQLRVVAIDRDYEKIFPPNISGDVFVVEDVHGLDEEFDEDKKLKRIDGSDGAPNGYQIIVYVMSPKITYKKTLLKRGLGWIHRGKVDLTDTQDMPEESLRSKLVKKTAEKLNKMMTAGSEWLKEQLRVLRKAKKNGIDVIVIDSTSILRALYGFEPDANSDIQDFETALSRALEEE